MKWLFLICVSATTVAACNSEGPNTATTSGNTEAIQTHSQSGIDDKDSKPNVIQVAMSSKDHSTLVAAVKQADLVNALSNAGPYTVFAPTNAAFDKLPKGTVDDLMKADKKEALTNILEYHVYVGVLSKDNLTDGMSLEMVNGDRIKITYENGQPVINGKVHITNSIPTSNGVIHVIDEVLVPPAK